MEKINPTGRCANLTDEKLFSLCKMFGARALEARRKFLGLLPEVNKRELAEKRLGRSWLARRGFSSIFEFAKKLAGASEEQVRVVLNLERRFEDKPVLQYMLINGEVSANKLARVVSIATKENQEALAGQIRILPNRAIEVLVRDVKNGQNILQGSDHNAPQTITDNGQNGLQMPIFEHQSLHVQTSGGEKIISSGQLLSMKINLKLNNDIITELHELQEKSININELLREALNKRRDEIAREKERVADQEIRKCTPKDDGGGEIQRAFPVVASTVSTTNKGDCSQNATLLKVPSSRYISVRVKKILAKEHGTKCSIPNCRRDAKEIHHTQRFALVHSHNPHFLAPLCKGHHLIAHGVDGRFWRRRRA